MMRLLIPAIFLILGLGGGIGAGMMLSGSPEELSEDSDAQATDAADESEDDADTDSSDDEGDMPSETASGSSSTYVSPASESTEYVRLRNQFIVPVVREGAVRSLVILALTVEVTSGGNDVVFQHEPRLRDSFLRVLFAHANAGGFDGVFTEAVAMAPLRDGLREAASAVLGNGMVRDVLIVDITRQDA